MRTFSRNKAAYLISKGLECSYTRPYKDKNVCFEFEDDYLAEKFSEDYETNEELRAFLDAFKEIVFKTRDIKGVK